MRHLIWYIKSAFCKHDWEMDETQSNVYDGNSIHTGKLIKTSRVVSATCKKCGWHRKYKKF